MLSILRSYGLYFREQINHRQVNYLGQLRPENLVHLADQENWL